MEHKGDHYIIGNIQSSEEPRGLVESGIQITELEVTPTFGDNIFEPNEQFEAHQELIDAAAEDYLGELQKLGLIDENGLAYPKELMLSKCHSVIRDLRNIYCEGEYDSLFKKLELYLNKEWDDDFYSDTLIDVLHEATNCVVDMIVDREFELHKILTESIGLVDGETPEEYIYGRFMFTPAETIVSVMVGILNDKVNMAKPDWDSRQELAGDEKDAQGHPLLVTKLDLERYLSDCHEYGAKTAHAMLIDTLRDQQTT